MKEISSLVSKDTLVYGGRGETVPVQEAIPAQIAYLKKADAVVTKLAKLPGDQTASIKTELEKSFPTYDLSYMIQYGVYGLIQARQ